MGNAHAFGKCDLVWRVPISCERGGGRFVGEEPPSHLAEFAMISKIEFAESATGLA
jgi:hypothetical protein